MSAEHVDVMEAASAFEEMFDDNLELIEESTPDDATQDVADALEEELDEEGGEEEEEESEESEEDPEETDDDSEEGEEDGHEDSQELSDDTLLDIDIDGEAYEVNLHELKAGYLRQEEYTKRATELEAEHAQKMAELSQKEAELIREIEATAVIAQADLSKYNNIDWAKLKAEDPAKYAQEFSEFMERRQAIQAQMNRRSQIQALHQKAEQIKHEAYLKEQMGLVRKLIPDFDNKDYQEGIFKYAESIGLTRDEVGMIADARHLLILDQARKYQESQVKRKGVIEKRVKSKELPPVVKPGAKKPAADAGTKRQKALEARAASTGDIRDAAAAFEAFI